MWFAKKMTCANNWGNFVIFLENPEKLERCAVPGMSKSNLDGINGGQSAWNSGQIDKAIKAPQRLVQAEVDGDGVLHTNRFAALRTGNPARHGFDDTQGFFVK